MIASSTRPAASPPRDPVFRAIMLVAIVLESLLYAATWGLDEHEFMRVFSCPDTGAYVEIARSLVDQGTVSPESIRTLGYPLYLSCCFALAGRWGFRLALAGQLVMNLVFVWIGWQFLARIAGHTRVAVRVIMAAVLFVDGLGLAVLFLTDLQAAMFFGLFLYGLFFKRSWPWVALAGISVFLAALTRPTFALFFVLLPVLAPLVRQFSTRVPKTHLCIYVLCILLGNAVSWRQNQLSRSLIGGRESVLTWNIRLLDYAIGQDGDLRNIADIDRHQIEFHKRIAAAVGKPYEKLTRGEVDDQSTRLLTGIVLAHPVKTMVSTSVGFLKFLFVPIECGIMQFFIIADRAELYGTPIRLPLFLFWLPLWLLFIFPPLRFRLDHLCYYIATWLIVGYVLGVSGFWVFGSGERLRLPVLPLMLPWAAINLDWLIDVIAAKLPRNSRRLLVGNDSP
jgi:hypothetical protein